MNRKQDYDDLIHYILEAAPGVRGQPRQVAHVRDSIQCCCEAYTQAEGGNFEQILQRNM
jgi:hypothetical protein